MRAVAPSHRDPKDLELVVPAPGQALEWSEPREGMVRAALFESNRRTTCRRAGTAASFIGMAPCELKGAIRKVDPSRVAEDNLSMRMQAMLVVVEGEQRSQLGKRLNVPADLFTSLFVERGEVRLEPRRTDRAVGAWLEPVGRKLFVHAKDPRARWNGRDVPAAGALLHDGDELDLGGTRLRVRITDDLEAAYHETVHNLARQGHPVDRHAN